MDVRLSPGPLVVLKFGSSVLVGAEGFRAAAELVAAHVARGRKVVAVCSARPGATDELYASAGVLAASPAPELLARLVATGEDTSVLLLALALGARGVGARPLDAVGLGLVTRGPVLDAEPVSVDARAIHAHLATYPVVVVPGFVGVDAEGGLSLLGRGGSDLTALFLAHRLEAEECHLVKDVDGLYPADPRIHPGASPFERATWDDVLSLGAELVQEKALRYASRHGCTFRITATWGTGTWVGPGLRVAS